MTRIMMKLVIVFFVLGGSASSETKTVSLGSRYYLVDLPTQATGAVILALHGASRDPTKFREMINLTAPAIAEGYTVIYPSGSGVNSHLTWNATNCCGYAVDKQVDDIAFLDDVISDATERFALDPNKIYLTGMSNGSMMAETYAARRADKIKAVAGVSGTLDLSVTTAARVPLLHIHGLDDKVVPYYGGYGSIRSTAPFTAVPDEISAFVAAYGALQKRSHLIDPVADGTSVTEDDYVDALGVVQVRLLTVSGGRHGWPGGTISVRGITRDISAPTEILRFFYSHR